MTLDDLLALPPYSLSDTQRTAALLPLLRDLTQWHQTHCPPYRAITHLTAPAIAPSLAAIPWLPVTLFKFRSLLSVPSEQIRVTVQSSGTGGSRSRVGLDAETARLTARALAACLAKVTRGRRLPMLIIDTAASIAGGDAIGARAAAILGLMPYGRQHVFALDDTLAVKPGVIEAFLAQHHGEDILIYGFTFLIWQALLPACRTQGHDLSRAVLLHSGGWKKLEAMRLDNATFRQELAAASGLTRIHNFYGMAELPGTIMLEGEDGLLYPPNFADIIIRDPVTRQPVPDGQSGLVEILTTLPRSYPGHALLTEDIGMIAARDGGGMMGAGLTITGRAPRAEMRGCSNV